MCLVKISEICYAGEHGKLSEDFAGWARVAEEIEKRERRDDIYVGGVYWANIGAGIGSEETGKGERFTRPVLVLEKFNERMLFAIPITSQPQLRRGYHEIVVAGETEFLILCQAGVMDALRIEEFIDEVAPGELERIWKHVIKSLKYHFYKKSSPAEAEQDF